MDVGLVIEKTLAVIQKDAVPLLVGGVIIASLSLVTLGILGGPLWAAYFIMVLNRIREGKAMDVSEIFSELNDTIRYLIPFYLLGILIGIATMFLIVPGVFLATIWMLTFPLMVDNRKMAFGDAIRESYRIVQENGLVQHLAVAGILVAAHLVIGAVLFAIGGPILSAIGNGIALAFTVSAVSIVYVADIARSKSEPAQRESSL